MVFCWRFVNCINFKGALRFHLNRSIVKLLQRLLLDSLCLPDALS
jgi:hypothetical protein